MGEMEEGKIWRSNVKAHEINAESLYSMWHHDLDPSQQTVIAQAGILPFLKAVTYRSDTALCGALIDFIADGQLIVGGNRLQITEDEIQQATGLPNSGKDVSPSTDYDRIELTVRLTKFKIGANNSGLLLDFIVDPLERFAAKFLAYKLLGLKKPGYIPFKYVEIAIEVSQGVCFNWCKFLKERMLQQIELVHKERRGTFNYSTILQFLAFKAFNENWIPRCVVGDGEPLINVYSICGRDAVKGKEEKRMVSKGVSCIIDNIMKEHGHRVLGGSEETEAIPHSREKKKMLNSAYVWYTDKKLKLGSNVNEIPSSCPKPYVDEMPNLLPIPSNAQHATIEQNGCISFDDSTKLGAVEAEPKSSTGETDVYMMSHEEQERQRSKGLDFVQIDHSRLLSEKEALEEEKSLWEVEKAALEAQKMHLASEKLWALQEKQQLEMENSRLQSHLLQEIQITAELQRKLNKMKESWAQFSAVMKMECGDL